MPWNSCSKIGKSARIAWASSFGCAVTATSDIVALGTPSAARLHPFGVGDMTCRVPAAVIGRERELDALSAAATDAAAGRGRVVFLAGPTGSGKSALLKASTARIAESGTRS